MRKEIVRVIHSLFSKGIRSISLKTFLYEYGFDDRCFTVPYVIEGVDKLIFRFGDYGLVRSIYRDKFLIVKFDSNDEIIEEKPQ